ncbi:MAG: type II toxin-antitoxin system RelE/ParE family toxin [Candidatus Deferrimicrobium sp.]
MRRRKVVDFAESAVRDMEEILDWYREQRVPEVGSRLVREIFADVGRLPDFPESGRVVPELGVGKIRELIHPPFRIVYRIDDTRIRIVRVWRSEKTLKIPG